MSDDDSASDTSDPDESLDEPADDDTDGDTEGDSEGESDQERLEALQGDIDQVRKDAEDADLLEDPHERRNNESGDEGEEMDDQAATPPG